MTKKVQSNNSPLVSVALPVYNGEKYLAETLKSILSQTVTDMEVIISDNASTDNTAAICERFASQDSRISYHRNSKNLGANPNFNMVFGYATGKYFKWATYDDVMEPDYLEKCIAALEENTDAVLCQSYIQYIDAAGESLGFYKGVLRDRTSAKTYKRFGGVVLPAHAAHEVLGVYRREALENSVLFPSYHGADRATLAENALRGHIIMVPEPLFHIRDHVDRYSYANTEMVNRAEFYDPSKVNERSFPIWRMYGEYWRLVGVNVSSRMERLRCYGQLLRWLWCNWNSIRLAVDVIRVVSPGFAVFAERFKQKYISPEPGMGEARAVSKLESTPDELAEFRPRSRA
jgi:glycosyltransferase involved in cell wall biosynthesis